MAYIPERSDVIWVDFDPTRGVGIQKIRPALVLSPKAFNQRTRLVLVAPITSTVRGHAFEVSISGDQVSGVNDVLGIPQRPGWGRMSKVERYVYVYTEYDSEQCILHRFIQSVASPSVGSSPTG